MVKGEYTKFLFSLQIQQILLVSQKTQKTQKTQIFSHHGLHRFNGSFAVAEKGIGSLLMQCAVGGSVSATLKNGFFKMASRRISLAPSIRRGIIPFFECVD